MKLWEAGVASSTYPYVVRWTGRAVFADTQGEAENKFGGLGFYRNLAVRIVEEEAHPKDAVRTPVHPVPIKGKRFLDLGG